MGGFGTTLSITLAAAALIVGCGDSSHSPLPEVASLGGPQLGHPKLVPIFFAGDDQTAQLTQFSQWIVTSNWLDQVGSEYGVGPGTMPGAVQRTDAAPTMITDDQIVDLVYAGLADHSLPAPTADTLYMVFFPSTTTITGGSATSCVDFGGYHASARRSGIELAYAVIAACDTTIDEREVIASHELIEAATDPLPDNHPGFQLADPTNPWLALGGEVADLCERGDASERWNEATFTVQRSWSNNEAAAGHDPCVPHSGKGVPYFSVTAEPVGVPRIPPGGHQTLQLHGWATDVSSSSEWRLQVAASRFARVSLSLGRATMTQGASTTLDVAIPAGTQPGTLARFFAFSTEEVDNPPTYQVLPMFAIAGDPCSSYTDCVSCSAQTGCGFCTTSGKCESANGSGSAESSCSGNSFATWPGSCTDFCASRGTDCTSCSSLPGCGWCGSGNGSCTEASHEGSHPEKASCNYADWSFTPTYCSR